MQLNQSHFPVLPYSGKHWQEKTLVNLVHGWQIAKVFTLKFIKFLNFNIHLPLLGHSPNFSLPKNLNS